MRGRGPLDFLDGVWIYRCGHTRETKNAYRLLVADPVGTRQSRRRADISMDRKEIRVFLSLTPRCVCTPRNIFIYVIGTTIYVISYRMWLQVSTNYIVILWPLVYIKRKIQVAKFYFV